MRRWVTPLCGCLGTLLLLSLMRTADDERRSLTPTHHLCILVPFRDRFDELMVFVPHMYRFLTEKNILFDIIVLNQVDEYRFNRATLINVGYYEALETRCDYMAMHDVDLLPINPELDYSFPEEGPMHVASPEYHPRYHYPKFIGGILLLRLDHYRLVNGMSNQYWGWGLEDDEFYLRLKEAKLPLYRSARLSSDRTNTFKHVHNKLVRPRDTVKLGDQKMRTKRRDRVSGVDTVQYDITARRKVNIDGFSVTVVDVELKCNLNWTPWCLTTLEYSRRFPNANNTLPPIPPAKAPIIL